MGRRLGKVDVGMRLGKSWEWGWGKCGNEGGESVGMRLGEAWE